MQAPGIQTGSVTTQLIGTPPLTLAEWGKRFKWPLLAVLMLVILLYARVFMGLASDWLADPNYSHGFAVPLTFVWLIWQRRLELATMPVKPVNWGLIVVALALVQLLTGQLGAEYFVARTSFLVLLSGLSLFLLGMKIFRTTLFPVMWLVFMIPLPSIIFYALTFPLQLLASRVAAATLDFLRIPNLREGNVLHLANFTFGVVEACSGIRSVISLLAFAVLLGHLRLMSLPERCVLAASAIAVSLCFNALRVVGTGVAGNHWGARWAEGFFHTFSGWVLFVGALAAVYIISGVLVRSQTVRIGISRSTV